jgi:hypothetical protein
MAEVIGRSYGGGILELEPGEADDLLLPDPCLVSTDLVGRIDERVRRGDIDGALDLGDAQLLAGSLGWSRERVTLAREAWTRLRSRRSARGKEAWRSARSASPTPRRVLPR